MVIYWYLIVLPRRLWQLMLVRDYDAALLQRGLLHPKSRPILERLLARLGVPIVYHLDDALWLLEPKYYRERVRLAARVVTGTESVAKFARANDAEVTEVAYPVEGERYRVREHQERKPVTIGWTGALAEEYLPTALPALLEVCRTSGARIQVIGGSRRPRLDGADPYLDWKPWHPEQKFEALADVDIGVLPLEDSDWHRGKEPFKLKEYMASGIPVVASPVGHVPRVLTDGREGYLAATSEEWTARLLELVADAGLRAKLGAAGRELVLDRFSFERQMGSLVEVFREIAGGSGIATAGNRKASSANE
ncbi:MAG: glycosyltransferase family 4 protein [Solirubrobacterales bacterium]